LFEKFYFPHNVDFRGRAYPIPPNLNHIGDDLSRGLLMFAEAKPLGPTGLRWLKIHCANLAGYDKASFTDRVQYIDDRIADVMDSADKPLEGNRWWLKAEDPWQCLATCISITEALRTPNPEEYMCHTVVAQDGTCNGLQHYAALGGDQEGARQVNLEPSDRPQDVYTGVAELVKAQIEKDVKEEHPLAMLLHGHITRKVVKQSVMTNVYGVTFVGARAQIQKQLEDNPAIPRADLTKCAGYLARLVFASISQVFTGATKIQHWLALCARIISRSVSPAQFDDLEDHYNGVLQTPKNESKSNMHSTRQKGKVEFMTSVVWTTPLKMAVVQPYRLEGSMCVQTNLQKIYITDPSVIDQVNSRKQMTAFPPNFIHSLDATHMLLSAMKCYQHGLTFAAVHDSFWTHPSDVDKLAGILREAFIGLHSVDIMERLKEEFETRYKGYKYRVAIPNSSPTAKLIKMARKLRAAELGQINLSEVDDLKWELQRDTYLASDDPELREKGAAMITPSVILDHAGGVESTQAKEDLGTTLGVIPETPAEEKKMKRDDDEAVEVEEDVIDEDDEIAEIEESESAEEEEEEAVEEDEEIEQVQVEKTKKAASNKLPIMGGGITHVWVPLVFPALPPKGEFDVTRLRESKYFFS
jgi:DNA-directed RNA polymerase